jgi:myosin I
MLSRTRRVPLEMITGLSMSSFADGYVVVHCHPACRDMGGADLLLLSIRKAEITTVLVEQLQLAGRELPLTFDDSIRYQSKGAGLRVGGISTRVLEFIEDAALGGKLACSELAMYARVACQ